MKKPTLIPVGGTDMPEADRDMLAYYQKLEIDTLPARCGARRAGKAWRA